MPPRQDNALPFIERPDLSPFLVHLTRNTHGSDGFTAYDNLRSILQTGEIFGSTTKSGFIKGSKRAACFMDVPLQSLKYVLNESATDPKRPRYEPYGVVITKKYSYKNGGRPVIYLSNAEITELAIPAEQLWRVVRLEGVDGTGVNWLHEREWRSKGNFTLPSRPTAVLLPTNKEVLKLRDEIEKDPQSFVSSPTSIVSLEFLCQGLPYLAAP